MNAALGQFVTLLAETMKRLQTPPTPWMLVPCGSFSKLLPERGSAATVDLFHDGSFFAASKLSAALRHLLLALAEVGARVEAADPAFRLPYAISANGERVGALPIALGKDVPWTRALRLAATNLKWLVAWSLKSRD